MAETIVQCDGCGAHGRRAENAAAPDFWFYIQSVDRTFGKDGIYVVWACSEACRDGMWKRGPGRGEIDDAGTFKQRERMAKANRSPVCSTCKDTHRMPLRDGWALCTQCPTPCQSCASNDGTGAYCASTPCACACHGGAS